MYHQSNMCWWFTMDVLEYTINPSYVHDLSMAIKKCTINLSSVDDLRMAFGNGLSNHNIKMIYKLLFMNVPSIYGIWKTWEWPFIQWQIWLNQQMSLCNYMDWINFNQFTNNCLWNVIFTLDCEILHKTSRLISLSKMVFEQNRTILDKFKW